MIILLYTYDDRKKLPPTKKMIKIIFFSFCFFLFQCTGFSQQSIKDQSYFYGRNYFVLRSGQAKMVIQSDKVDIGSSFTYLLFNADDPSQTSSKEKAFNYIKEEGFSSSTLEVILKDYAFIALGTNTITRWILEQGIPSVEAIWWASGVKVREIITPISTKGVFKRTIVLESADMVTRDTINLKLSLPTSASLMSDRVMITKVEKASIGLVVEKGLPVNAISSKKSFNIGPIILNAGEKKIIETYLFLDLVQTNNSRFYSKINSTERQIQDDLKLSRDVWDKLNSISTKDTLIKNIFNVARYILPGYVSDKGLMDAGIFEYGNQWVRDASHTALGIISIGNFEIARAILDNILKNMIAENGATMISGRFDEPDKEQFDQMGELMHTLKSYIDWTGDTSLLSDYKNKIVAMVERPLSPVFRDQTGMVHNRREFWERTFDDAYELAYQTWVIQGLRDAADLSTFLGLTEKGSYWRAVANEIQESMLSNSKMKLVNNGHLIKRRNITGKIADTIQFSGWVPGAPATVEKYSRLMPDATMALPISLGIIDPLSSLSESTLVELEKLWNRRWAFGGYDRYNTSSQGDQPGPWTFATTFILRAQHAALKFELSRRSLNWLYNLEGGKSGAWFEEIPIIKTNKSGILPWTSAEIAYFFVHDFIGLKFIGDRLIIKPSIYDMSAPVKAKIRYCQGRINLEIRGSGNVSHALINGAIVYPTEDSGIIVPKNFKSGDIIICCKREGN